MVTCLHHKPVLQHLFKIWMPAILSQGQCQCTARKMSATKSGKGESILQNKPSQIGPFDVFDRFLHLGGSLGCNSAILAGRFVVTRWTLQRRRFWQQKSIQKVPKRNLTAQAQTTVIAIAAYESMWMEICDASNPLEQIFLFVHSISLVGKPSLHQNHQSVKVNVNPPPFACNQDNDTYMKWWNYLETLVVQENVPLDKFKTSRKINLTVSSLQYVTFYAPPLCCTALYMQSLAPSPYWY